MHNTTVFRNEKLEMTLTPSVHKSYIAQKIPYECVLHSSDVSLCISQENVQEK